MYPPLLPFHGGCIGSALSWLWYWKGLPLIAPPPHSPAGSFWDLKVGDSRGGAGHSEGSGNIALLESGLQVGCFSPSPCGCLLAGIVTCCVQRPVDHYKHGSLMLDGLKEGAFFS